MCDLPHSKNEVWTNLWNLKFYERLLVNDRYYASKWELICINSRVLGLKILISNINFEKKFFFPVLSPYRLYVPKNWQSESNQKSLVVY